MKCYDRLEYQAEDIEVFFSNKKNIEKGKGKRVTTVMWSWYQISQKKISIPRT